MASFPNSVKTFTTKNAGDVIQPVDINDPQDEINAIEDGLLNGKAPLNSSNSTFHALSVTAGSTLATLQVTGDSTFAGNVVITGTLTGGGVIASAACKLSHSTFQQMNSGAFLVLNWDTEVLDAQGMHSTSANSSRITFAASSGLYCVGANLVWNTVASGSYSIRFKLNDGDGIAGHSEAAAVTGGNGPMSLSAMVYATSTSDYVTCQVFQSGGSTNSIVHNSTLNGPSIFWAYRVA